MENKENKKVKFNGKLLRIIYESGDFKIVSFETESLMDLPGGLKVTVKGNFPTLQYGMLYNIVAQEVEDKKYGKQYNLISIYSDIDMKDGNQVKKFFSYFLTGYQINKLFQEYKDPVEILESGDVKKLCAIKGIGIVTAERILIAYQLNKDKILLILRFVRFVFFLGFPFGSFLGNTVAKFPEFFSQTKVFTV